MAGGTAERVQGVALELFAERGFDGVTVEEIAAAAGVSHMTFFRHFPTKESVVLADPWDPVVAAAVAAQPDTLPAIERIRRGLLAVLARMGDTLDEDTRIRIRLTAGHPRLRAGMWENNEATSDAIVAALVADGVEPFEARVATGACLGALMAALLDWGVGDGEEPLRARIERALDVLEVGHDQR